MISKTKNKDEIADIHKQIIKYCEDMAIYDKLSQYGDFYYKLKEIVNNQK